MSWRGRLGRWIAGGEAWTVEAESDAGWRSVGGGGSEREVGWQEARSKLEESDDAYRYQPLAHRIVELTVDFVLGGGMRLVSEDARAQRWLDDWWADPRVSWAIRQADVARELVLAGEVFPTFHPDGAGSCVVRLVPALQIEEIETSAEDVEDELGWRQAGGLVLVDGVTRSGGVTGGRWWRPAGDPPVMRHYASTRLVGTVRGQGDLVAVLPWLRRYRDWLTDRVRLNKHRQAFLFDVTLKGADRRTLATRQSELTEPPPPGSVLVHNDGEAWQTVQAGIAAPDAEADGLALRLMIAAGAGVPLHYLSEAQSANLATASAMEMPSLRRLERKQTVVREVMVAIARTAMEVSGSFPDGAPAVRTEVEAVRTDDLGEKAAAAERMAGALRVACEAGWIRDAEARELMLEVMRLRAGGIVALGRSAGASG